MNATDVALTAGQLNENPLCWDDPPAGDVNRDSCLNALDLVELQRIAAAK